jgi:hypothetical protein
MSQPAPILPDRLAEFAALPLKKGAHRSPSDGMCALEAAAWIAGEPHSDHPACVCPVLGAFGRLWNDSLPDAERDRLLRPLVPRLIGTRGSAALAERRSLMAADWLVREHTPAWLRLAGLTEHADALAGLPEITSLAQVRNIGPAIDAARRDAAAARAAAGAAAGDAAGDAAWEAAGAAALEAAWDAARAAARDAAWAAARDAAWAAAWAAAREAARDAAGDAAGDAARAKLNPTQEALQQSALALVERMIAADGEGRS